MNGEGLKLISQKHVGPYKVVLLHDIKDSGVGAVSLATLVGRELHNTGKIPKEHATKMYGDLKTEKHVEEFLARSQSAGNGRSGFGYSVKY